MAPAGITSWRLVPTEAIHQPHTFGARITSWRLVQAGMGIGKGRKKNR